MRTDVSDWYVEKGVRFRYETWRRVVDQVTLEATLKDRLALARRNVAEFSGGNGEKRLKYSKTGCKKTVGSSISCARRRRLRFLRCRKCSVQIRRPSSYIVISVLQNALGTIFETLFT